MGLDGRGEAESERASEVMLLCLKGMYGFEIAKGSLEKKYRRRLDTEFFLNRIGIVLYTLYATYATISYIHNP